MRSRLLRVQVMIIPISEASQEYAQSVRAQIRRAKLLVDIDTADKKMQKKVFEAQVAQYNYILVRAVLPSYAHSDLERHNTSWTVFCT